MRESPLTGSVRIATQRDETGASPMTLPTCLSRLSRLTDRLRYRAVRMGESLHRKERDAGSASYAEVVPEALDGLSGEERIRSTRCCSWK